VTEKFSFLLLLLCAKVSTYKFSCKNFFVFFSSDPNSAPNLAFYNIHSEFLQTMKSNSDEKAQKTYTVTYFINVSYFASISGLGGFILS
jgi:hypothetical protein